MALRRCTDVKEYVVEVTVDGVLIDEAFLEEDATVETALKHVQSELCDEGRMVVGVQCNGDNIAPDAMADTLCKPAASFERIEVFTDTRGALVTRAMKEASSCLTETEEACQRVAVLLTEGQTVDAAETLGDCLRVWQQVHEAVAKSMEMLELDPDQTMLGESNLTTVIGAPKEVLLQIRGALQSQDFVLLADILEYEFSEVTKRWHSVVELIHSRAEV